MGPMGRIVTTGALILVWAFPGAPPARAVDRFKAVAERRLPPGVERLEAAHFASELDLSDLLGPDAVVQVSESVFNKAAAAIEPVPMKGDEPWRVPDWVPYFGGDVICKAWTADVTGITVGIDPDGVSIKANVRAHYCNQAVTADIDTTGDIVYDPAGRHFLVTIDPTSVRPKFVVTIDVKLKEWKFYIPLPVTIDLGEIKVPPIPVRSFFFTFETSRGSGTLHGTPRDIALVKYPGYLRLQSDMLLW